MIAKPTNTYKSRLSKSTIQSIRLLARKGTDKQIEEFIYRVAMNYIADVRDTDYIEEEDYLKVKDKVYECECPSCGQTFTLDFEPLTQRTEIEK